MAAGEIIKKVREGILENGVDIRYKLGAYQFVLNGLDFYLTSLGEKRHVSGTEFSFALLGFAHNQYGPVAQSVLREWGIKSTEDFGNIVYNMIQVGILSKQPEDSLDHFVNVVNFDDWFSKQDPFKIDPNHIKRIKGA
ncbi:hypothetical protein QA601_03995 [Chitinispirillales bacterium ANBcel5]|uniref:Minf_1886 family protein n=1 Tax=Cellulosispirillum alkaliphilum TaxID=3039283 RepID=UPI002A583AC8|nr:hypothetical protein [Chitinispirillales bacterium ANBcel5]